MEQLDMFSLAEPMRSDEIVTALRPSINATILPFNLSPRHVSFGILRENIKKPNERKVGRSIYFSIAPSTLVTEDNDANKSRGGLICRFKDQVRRTFLEFPMNRLDYYKGLGDYTKVGAADAYYRINLEAIPDLNAIASAVCADISARLRNFPSDFSCCSLYVQCSNAGRCIAVDQDFAAGCYYKKNLMSGSVFYGKNAKKEGRT